MTRQFRALPQGHRRVGPYIASSGWRLEEMVNFLWLYVDVMPDRESAESYARNCGGVIL